MKKAEYNTSIKWSKNGLMYCKCSCECGGEGDEKIICVHVLSVIMKLSHLLFDGLVEHLLVELTLRWGQTLPDFGSEEEQQHVFTNIHKLMCSVSTENIDKKESNVKVKTISELLRSFMVGTEKTRIPPQPPHNHQFTMLRSYDYKNPSTKSMDLVKNHLEKKDNLQESSQKSNVRNDVKSYLPNYIVISRAVGILRKTSLHPCITMKVISTKKIRQ